ncbi:AEC family transporter (plasmid) [Nocardia sp. CA-084685]|uniref:AEC family transporter n=1 Tax=Nocardia sp. CA-084685 TaxID=3239970 RepID=UPI003D96BEA3
MSAVAVVGEVLGPVTPIVLIFTAGAYFARRKIIAASDSRVLSEFAFRLAIPAYLLGKLYVSDLRQLFDPASLTVYAITALVAAAAIGIWSRLVHHTSIRGVALRIMAGVQVNTAYFAIPVLVLVFGDAAPIFPILLFQVLVLTVVVITIMEAAPNDDDLDRSPGQRITRGVWRSLTTPVVLACLTGVVLNALHVPIPGLMLTSLSFVGDAASPVALFALGLYVGGTGLRWRGASTDENSLVAFKCIGFPLLMWGALQITGIPDPWRGYLILIAAMPAPQNLFTFAQTYDTDVDLAASAVLKSTLLSLCLLPIWQLLIS